MEITKARNEDAEELTKLTKKSKAYWGYSDEQISLWEDDLRITPYYLENNVAFVIKSNNHISGYYAYRELSGLKVKLDYLFIDPMNIGSGLGKVLLNHLFEQIINAGYRIITLDADPYAESFYLKFGFKTIGQLPSSIPERTLPIMEFHINSIDGK